MSDKSTTLSPEEIALIAEKDDFHIAPLRADGDSYGTPTWIWVVEVEGKLFVRAYNGTRSSWYQSAIKQKAGIIEAAGMVKKVRFDIVDKDDEINRKIDEAYRRKYGTSPYLDAMISSRAKAATVQVLVGS